MIGLASGCVAGSTGIAAVPFLPYMQSLDMDRNELVQALGIMFLFIIGALTAALALQGSFTPLNLAGGIGAAESRPVPRRAGSGLRGVCGSRDRSEDRSDDENDRQRCPATPAADRGSARGRRESLGHGRLRKSGSHAHARCGGMIAGLHHLPRPCRRLPTRPRSVGAEGAAPMQWSQLRARVRDLLADSVAGRVDVHMAGYGSSSIDRAWLALDGRDVLSIPEYLSWHREGDLDRTLLAPSRPEGVLLHEGRVTTIGWLLHRYLESPFADLASSPTVFLRGFARFDRRFGKRRLAEPPAADEHPFVVHCHLFRATAEGIAIDATGPGDAARWHRPRPRGGRSPEAGSAADRRLRERKDRPFASIVRRVREGSEPPRAGSLVEARLAAALAPRDGASADALAADLLLVADRSDIADDAALAPALVSLLACDAPRIRPPDTWQPSTHNAARQFSALARHLFAKYDLPRFLDRAWSEGDDRERAWFVHLGTGASLRDAPGLPAPVSRTVAGWFLRAPDDCPVTPALRWAEVRARGGSAALADAVRRTRLGRDFSHGAFWGEVIAFFVANPFLDPGEVGPIVDWIQAQRFEPEVEPGEAIARADAAPPRPNLSMRGRTVEATLREVEAWHRRLGRTSAETVALEWPPSGIPPHEAIQGTDPDTRRVFTIREITSGAGLAREGERMSHCVASYARSCAQGTSSIWTLECTTGGEATPLLTIQVHAGSRRIGQARGRHNRAALPEELAILARWAAAAGLVLDVG